MRIIKNQIAFGVLWYIVVIQFIQFPTVCDLPDGETNLISQKFDIFHIISSKWIQKMTPAGFEPAPSGPPASSNPVHVLNKSYIICSHGHVISPPRFCGSNIRRCRSKHPPHHTLFLCQLHMSFSLGMVSQLSHCAGPKMEILLSGKDALHSVIFLCVFLVDGAPNKGLQRVWGWVTSVLK